MFVLFIIAAVIAGLQGIVRIFNMIVAIEEDLEDEFTSAFFGFVWAVFFVVMFILAAIHV